MFVQFLASFMIYFLFLGLIILWFIDGKIKKEQVVHSLFSVCLSFVIAVTIKEFFPSSRPYFINNLPTNVFIPPVDAAFPSTHTAIAFALSTTIFLHDRSVGLFFILSALLIGVARVVANVHYPADIFGGAFLGTFVAVLVDKTHFLDIFIKKKKKRYH